MSYTRLYLNGWLFLAKGLNRKVAHDGTRMVGDFWEVGVGRVHVVVGRWRET